MVRLSVIIPTFRRPDLLRQCLESISRQSVPHELYEVLVVVDGQDAVTGDAVKKLAKESALPVRCQELEKRGPAFARNWAIDAAQGEILLFLNDDIALTPEHFAEHLRLHEANPGHAVRGHTRWHPDVLGTAFMRWVAQTGLFYYLITDYGDIGYEYFHTLDLSIHRSWLREDRFSLDFPDASFEDTELGYRLMKKGLKLAFAPNAISYHYHFYTPKEFFQKARINGRSAVTLVEKQPELYDRIIGMFLVRLQGQKLMKLVGLFISGQRNTPSYWSTLYEYVYAREVLRRRPDLAGRVSGWPQAR
jgi:glycosyltransferase involved in cell wall biosynthesis